MYQYICKECGKEFLNANKNRVYCSNSCRITAIKRDLAKRQKDLTNQRFGRLTALYSKNVNKRYKWFCKCDCGEKIWVPTERLLNGHTKSCGCLSKHISSQNSNKNFEKYRQKNYIENTSISKIKSKNNKNNSSGIRGVHYNKTAKAWVAKLTFQKKTYSKNFSTKSKAIKYRKELEKKYFDPFLEKYDKTIDKK